MPEQQARQPGGSLYQTIADNIAAVGRDKHIFPSAATENYSTVLLGLYGFLLSLLAQQPDTAREIWLHYAHRHNAKQPLPAQVAFLKQCQKQYTIFRTVTTHAQQQQQNIGQIFILLADYAIDLIGGSRSEAAKNAMDQYLVNFVEQGLLPLLDEAELRLLAGNNPL